MVREGVLGAGKDNRNNLCVQDNPGIMVNYECVLDSEESGDWRFV